jgi:hypothetical protein
MMTMKTVMKAISFLLLAHQAVAVHDEYKVSDRVCACVVVVVVGCKEEEKGCVQKREW